MLAPSFSSRTSSNFSGFQFHKLVVVELALSKQQFWYVYFYGFKSCYGKAHQAYQHLVPFCHDVVLDNNVQLYYIEGSENPADMFTKNLGHIKFSKFQTELGLHFY